MDWLEKAKLVENPYLRAFEELHSNATYQYLLDVACERSDSSEVLYSLAMRRQNDIRHELVHKYSWAVPTPEALATVAATGKVVEAGAGSGYWSSLLRKMGVDVVAFDQVGMDVASNHYHFRAAEAWTEIVQGDASTVYPYGDRTLFMCFPPYNEPFGYDVLRLFQGNRFVYVGEERGGVTGDDKFFDLLDRKWRQVKFVEIPQWEFSDEILSDALYVFKR